MRRKFVYITEDGRQFSNEEEAFEWESSLLCEAKDLTFKHDYKIGETVYLCSRDYLWECIVEGEDFEIDSWYDNNNDIEYAKAKFNTLYLVSVTNPEESAFAITTDSQLRKVSRDLKDLLRVKTETIDNLFK